MKRFVQWYEKLQWPVLHKEWCLYSGQRYAFGMELEWWPSDLLTFGIHAWAQSDAIDKQYEFSASIRLFGLDLRVLISRDDNPPLFDVHSEFTANLHVDQRRVNGVMEREEAHE